MTSYKIPATLAAAQRELGALGQLLTATQWQRAALVYAFTEDDRGGDHRPGAKQEKAVSARISFKDFAALGISGLRDPGTVAEYHRAWARQVEDGNVKEAKPRITVQIPTIDWPGRQDEAGQKRYVERSEPAVARSLDRRDLDAEVLAQNMTDEVAEAVVARITEDRPEVSARARNQAFTRSMEKSGVPIHTGLAPLGPELDAVNTGVESAIEDHRAGQALATGVIRFTQRTLDAADDASRTEWLLQRGEHAYQQLGAALNLLRGIGNLDDIDWTELSGEDGEAL